MLDIRLIRENPELVKQAMRNRSKNMDAQIDELVGINAKRREINVKSESLKAARNAASKEIPAMKAKGRDVEPVMAEMREIADEIKELDARLASLNEEETAVLLSIPNVPHPSVPVGKTDEDNLEVFRHGTPENFDFEPKGHWDIGAGLGILEPERAAKVTGARFHFYKGLGARLERSVINFFLDTHTANGYTELLPPFIANRASMTATGQLPKFEEDMFKLEGLDYFLIPTAEVPVTNFHRDEILSAADLPVKYCAYSACFRKEAGSAGRDTRGLIRQHEFNKVELVKFTSPESSYDELEKLTDDAKSLLIKLGIPFRVVCLCTGDMGFSSAKTYDIEVWMPSYGRYLEISSCSNFEDFQARRASIRYKENVQDKAKLLHTLNGSGLAVGRTVAAILENHQNADGSVTVPEALRGYMGCNVIDN